MTRLTAAHTSKAAQADALDAWAAPSGPTTMHVGGGAVDTPSDAGSEALAVQGAEHTLHGWPPCQYTAESAVHADMVQGCTEGGRDPAAHTAGSAIVGGSWEVTQ